MTKDQYEQALVDRGCKKIGSGLYATVYSVPNTNKAIKVACLDDWPSYVYWATKCGYAGKFAPKVYSLKFKDDYYIALMERLVCTIGQTTSDRSSNCEQRQIYNEINSPYRKPVKSTECSDLLDFIADMRANSFSGDMHDGNAMLRSDGQLVITDPVARSNTSGRLRIKSGVCL